MVGHVTAPGAGVSNDEEVSALSEIAHASSCARMRQPYREVLQVGQVAHYVGRQQARQAVAPQLAAGDWSELMSTVDSTATCISLLLATCRPPARWPPPNHQHHSQVLQLREAAPGLPCSRERAAQAKVNKGQ